MKGSFALRGIATSGLMVAVLGIGGPVRAGMPEVPKVSTFAPAEDLASQVPEYIDSLQKSVASEQEYKDSAGKIAKESNTLVLVALALGLHDQDSKYKAAAPALVKAAQDVAAAKDFAAAKTAVDALAAAAEGKAAAAAELKWEKKASLDDLMEQVPLINTKMKRYLKGSRFKSNAKDTAGYSAVLAVIAQGSMPDTSEAKGDEQKVQKWFAFCAQMRQAAAELNQAIHAGNEAGADEAVKKLSQSCEDCHAVFKTEK